ncbi:ligand-binding sensor domain-containing protein [Fodinibius saliphilus]|uniref:ligand-binding sensor domain-containing protein n=1 Tax=Fodinibius saliphilus TaxID=1920650 RepID=UPI001108C345|nr:sensor histidine kinase [Fodinibius saliphilus]
MKRLVLIIIFIAGVSIEISAQTLPFRTYSIERGLSESVVNDMIQDDDGHLWIGTSYGLNRFDGISFDNFYSEDGLSSNKIFSLYEANNGLVWVGTSKGVNIIRKDSIYTPPYLKSLNASTILSIYQDDIGDFWFATDGEGVWHLDSEKKVSQYRQIHGMGSDRIRDIIQDANGVLWFATRDGLTKLENGNFRTFTRRHGLADDRLRDVEISKDTLWVASRGGLCHFTNNAFRCFTEQDGLVNNRIQSISKDNDGNLWLGTEDGASLFENGNFTNYSVEEGLANNIIYATHYDHEGNIWFGTFGGGITIFLGNQFRSYTVEHGLPNNVVTSITQDQDGQYWVSTYGGGVVRIRDNELSVLDVDNGLVDNKVYTLSIDQENRLLIGTRWGFSIYENGEFYNYDEVKLPYRKIRTVIAAKGSDGIWLGTYGEGIIHYVDGKFKQYTEDDGLANNTVLALEETPDGTLWVATYGGISKLKNDTFTNYSIADGLPNNGVLDLYTDSSEAVWIATFGGLARLKDGRIETITTANGLPNEVCYFIERDDRGFFWIGTNKGVIRFDYEEYSSNVENTTQSFKLFTQDQGLVANEMNAGAVFKDRDGHLWFGTVGGVTEFNPNFEKNDDTPPHVHIENIEVSGKAIPLEQNLEIGSDNHNITFEFIGISFSAPEQVMYEYRLKNSGEGWQKTKQPSVRYSALMAGDYTFEVKAQNYNGKWSRETAKIRFTVLAPFWQQWWFIGIVILTILAIVAFIYNYYRVRKMVDIERMRVRIASDLHDDVGSSLTEIALQSDFLQTMDVSDGLEESLQQIGAQSRKIVSSLDDIVWSIDARNDTMGDLTDRMQDYVNNVLSKLNVHYHFDGDMQAKLEVSHKENLYLIFKEAINNIAKHSNADTVSISLAMEDQGFMLSVKDNGTSSTNDRKSGQGLRNMEMRANRIDADIIFESENGFEVRVEKFD